MKQWFWTWMITAGLLSCSSNKAELDEIVTTLSVSDEIVATDWEQYTSWQVSDSANFDIHFTTRPLPALTQDVINRATVITYSKVTTNHIDFLRFNNPISLDYYFVPSNAKPIPGHFHWYGVHSSGKIRVSFSILDNTPLPGDIPLTQYWFRHIVIPPHILQSMGLTIDNLKSKYSYEQVIQLLGIKP